MNKHGKRLITLAALATTTTAIIHIANKVVAASAGLKEMLDTNGKNYYHWRFGDIYYTRKGKGSPILLIHDMLPGGSGYEWNKIEDDLALEHTVYIYQLCICPEHLRFHQERNWREDRCDRQRLLRFLRHHGMPQRRKTVQQDHDGQSGQSGSPETDADEERQTFPQVSGSPGIWNTGLPYGRIQNSHQ